VSSFFKTCLVDPFSFLEAFLLSVLFGAMLGVPLCFTLLALCAVLALSEASVISQVTWDLQSLLGHLSLDLSDL
jgi:hypothetical protein